MKLACSSTAFDELLRSGNLTQLEWIDLCAHELAADGIVADVRHFPRTDTDYLAQVKKMAADLGLTVGALRHDGFFGSDEALMDRSLEMALAIGAPLLSAPLPPETAVGWNDVQASLGAATSLAKRRNITIALRNVPHTFAASVHDMKRVSKEADSAWLRYGPEPGRLEAGSDPAELLPKTVIVWNAIDRCSQDSVQTDARLLERFRGFVSFDHSEGAATPGSMRDAMVAWRSAVSTAA